MNVADFQSAIEEFAFEKVGEIALGDALPNFEISNSSRERGFVYLWVEAFKREFVVVYVGKAGGTLLERCQQHVGGFKSSSTGQAHAKRIQEGIAQGKRYVLYARKSPNKTIVGERDVSMACVEERAFIKKFNPPWNAV